MSGVSAVHVPKVIRPCAQTFGVNIGCMPSPRSIGRFILEGGVGVAIQIGDILANAQGITTSMDSTSQQNINFSSMHVMANTESVHKQLYLAVKSTTETRRIDTSKLEATRKAELVLAAENKAKKNQAIQEKRVDRRIQRQEYVAGIQLELDQTVVAKMKGSQLNDQLKLYQHILANQQGFPSTSKLKVDEKRALVSDMALKYVQAESILQVSS